MTKYVLASVGDFYGYDKNTGEIVFQSRTLTQSGMNFSVTENQVKGGMLNSTLASYFSDAEMTLSLTDALFSMDALALNTGSSITAGGNKFTTETVACSESGKLTVTGNPQNFSNIGTIGWVTEKGKDNWTKVTFVGSLATYAGAVIGKEYCVKYLVSDLGAEVIKVSSAFIPSQVYGVLSLPLFRCSDSDNVAGSSSQIGEVVVEVPSLQFTGSMDLSLTANGNATMPINAKALANYDTEDCANGKQGYYAKLTKIVYNSDIWADISGIVVESSNIELEDNETLPISVKALFANATKAPRSVDYSDLTITSSSASVATVLNGIITATGTGTATITVVVTEHPEFTAKAVVTVTA